MAILAQRMKVRRCFLNRIVLARMNARKPNTFRWAIVRMVLSEKPRNEASKPSFGER